MDRLDKKKNKKPKVTIVLSKREKHFSLIHTQAIHIWCHHQEVRLLPSFCLSLSKMEGYILDNMFILQPEKRKRGGTNATLSLCVFP